MTEQGTHYCGFVTLIGRPNVGKSTLLNRLIGQKIAITSRKPQTTRHRILGVQTDGPYQTVYIDTPGLHTKEPQVLNRWMNRTASCALKGVDLILMLVEGTRWTDDDQRVLTQLPRDGIPVILVVNKIDCIPRKPLLLETLERLQGYYPFLAIVPISAEQGEQVDVLASLVRQQLPIGSHHFPEDYVTDRSQRFLVAELIREKLVRFLGDELPYALTVEIEVFRESPKGGYQIHGLIWVGRAGQKRIVIGAQGEKLKIIGQAARQAIETLLEAPVYLGLWVKVKSGWANDARALARLGYRDE
ncbi:MAG: GTPase Era [Candidatus Symbiodolus clandestinus]